ncbi:MAG: undecaprenyldiphospho-muramoylpentapeptide beta-N-acetylglucosaminyltransferase [Bacteroidota bacterium]|nr:undecaprenyldiphospho-muramoylpentapeptide beta-N-acetylglucosaminyltransferase [Bacteroidota bacterium]
MKVIISGGGTGGHIFPAIAIAKCLQRRFKNCEILFVGAEGKMEMQKVPQAGFRIIGLKIAGLQRKKLWKNFSLPFKMLSSYIKAKKIIKTFCPDVVVGVGGYASWAILGKAQKLGIPTLLQEQNSFAGKSNQILANKAKKICVTYDNMERFFPAEKIVKTGNPVRKNICDIRENLDNLRQKGLGAYAFDTNKPTVLVVGGSLGARSINESIESNLDYFINNNIQLIWQTGKFYYNDIVARNNSKIKQHPNIRILEFISDMDLVYAVADVVVSRAGALAISELCIVGKPVVLVPSPNVAEDHQRRNAEALVEKNAAVMILDNQLKEKFLPTLSNIIKDKELQINLGKNILTLAKVDADEKIVDEIEKIAMHR